MYCANHVFCILYFCPLAAMYRNHNSLVLSIAGFASSFIATMDIQHMLSGFIHFTRFKCLAKRSCGFWITEKKSLWNDEDHIYMSNVCVMLIIPWRHLCMCLFNISSHSILRAPPRCARSRSWLIPELLAPTPLQSIWKLLVFCLCLFCSWLCLILSFSLSVFCG